LDALVQALVDQRCGSFLSDNVYIRKEISPQTQSVILPRVESLPVLLPALYKRLTV
jgi:hypothetical protein